MLTRTLAERGDGASSDDPGNPRDGREPTAEIQSCDPIVTKTHACAHPHINHIVVPQPVDCGTSYKGVRRGFGAAALAWRNPVPSGIHDEQQQIRGGRVTTFGI